MGLLDQIIGVESGGDPNARNPNSSATGLGQFIDSTWLATIAKHRPDLAEGKSPSEILAMRSNGDLSKEMTAAYASDNAAVLSKAGHEATPGNTYLAHFAGPGGAVAVLNADPTTPVASLLTPGAMKANPFLQGMTAADLRAWSDRKMGGAQRTASAEPVNLAPPENPAPAVRPIPSPQTLLPSSPSLLGQAQFMGAGGQQTPNLLSPLAAPQRRNIDLSKLQAMFPRRHA